MNAPPGFSVCATLNALRTISGHDLGLEDLRRVLGNRREQVHQIEYLVALLVQPGGRALAGDADDRRPIHVGVGEAGDQIGRARAQRRHAHARPARQPPVDVGHERRPLLVPGRDELDRAVEQRIHDVDVLFAGNAEDVFDALVLEASYEQLRCFHGPSQARVSIGVVPMGDFGSGGKRRQVRWLRETGVNRAPRRRPAAVARSAPPSRSPSPAGPAG